MKMHRSLTIDRVLEAARRTMFDLEMIGFCTACGDETDGVEPDAERRACRACGDPRGVYGAEQIMLHLVA